MKLLLAVTLVLLIKQTLAEAAAKNQTDSRSNNYQIIELKLAVLEAKLARQEAQNAALSARVAAQDARATACEKWRNEQEQRDASLLRDIQALRTSITGQKSNVSFLAISNVLQTVPGHGFVKFPNVLHNAAPSGYGFDSTISHFRCPEDGVYVFHFSVTTSDAGTMWFNFALVKGSAAVSGASAWTNSNNRHESMSAMAVIPCRRDEYVYVKNLDGHPRNIYKDSNGFTGFKIY